MAFGYDAGGTGRHGLHIDSTNHIYSDGEFIFGSTGAGGQYISASDGNIEISSSNFHLTNAGNVTMAGKVTADTGEIGGWGITASEIKSGTTFILDSATNSGELKIGSSGGPGSATGTSTGIYLAGDGNWALVKDAENRIYNDGTNLVVKSEDFSLSGSTTLAIDTTNIILGADAHGASVQTLTSGTGVFMSSSGHFRVGEGGNGRIEFDGTNLILSSSQFFLGKDGDGGQYVSGSDGKLEISSSQFHLSSSGDVTMAGTLQAAGGTFAGTVEVGNVKLGENVYSTNDGIYLGNTNNYWYDGGEFKVGTTNSHFLHDGSGKFQLSGSDVQILTKDYFMGGTDSYISGSPNRIEISGSNVSLLTDSFYFGSGQEYVSGSDGKLEISSSNFHLTNTGNVTMAGTVTAESGYIGTAASGFTLTSAYFTSNASKTSVTDTDSGVYVGTDGFAAGTGQLIMKSSGQISGSTFKFSDNLSGDVSAARYGDAEFDNYVYNDGSSFNIQTEAFNLNTANIIISSSNNGVISLGSTPPTDWEGVGASNRQKGFYVSGLGSLLLGNSDGGRIQYNHSTETLIMSSSGFMLGKGKTGTGGQFISGSPDSGGTIEISSSNFHLSKTGDVTMAGTVSSSAGDIGGWNIETGGITQTSASQEIGLATTSGSFYIQDSSTKQYVARFGYFMIDEPGVVSASFFDRLSNGDFETGTGTDPRTATGWTLDWSGVGVFAKVTGSTESTYEGSYGVTFRLDIDAGGGGIGA